MKNLLCLVCLVIATYMKQSEAQPCNASGVGYEGLDCYFSILSPFTSPERPADVCPQSPDIINTTYQLYTRKSDQPQTLDAKHLTDVLKVFTNFAARPTVVLIHGVRGKNEDTPWLKKVADALLTKGDYNIIIIDWSGGSSLIGSSGGSLIPFKQAAANSRVVGCQTAKLVNYLCTYGGVVPGDFYLIGHSIGAHIAGDTGRQVLGIGRITGLDPCGPRYTHTDLVVRLDKGDALLVDVIHTNIPGLLSFGIGTPDLSGHMDFFPNGGSSQPGCDLISALPKGIQGLSDYLSCSHSMSHEFLIASFNATCVFTGYPCASYGNFKAKLCQSCGTVGCAPMGFPADKFKPSNGQTVKYYLDTAAEPPYCLGSAATNSG